MSITWDFPEAIELEAIEQITLPKLVEDMNSPFFMNFPTEAHENSVIAWEQLDNYTGLMTFRGYNGEPSKVRRIGQQRFIATPGVYGNFIPLQEDELTRRRAMAQYTKRMGIADLVAQAQNSLLTLRLNLIEKILADLCVTGTYSVPDGSGITGKSDSFTPLNFNATVPWSTKATATPLADMRAAQLLTFGQSVDMGPAATLYINRVTFNNLIGNTNAADLGGKRLEYGQTLNTPADINKILAGENLPSVQIYEGFYNADDGSRKGVATRFIPNTKGLLFGKRMNGAKIGAFAYTWNFPAGGAAKPYTRVIDKTQFQVPGSIEVHDGFNGGPIIRYPGAMINFTNL